MDSFNKPLNRKNTNCIKWDIPKEKNNSDDLLPFFIADSDYQTAPAIIDALVQRSLHGAFGYTFIDEQFRDIVKQWVKRRYHYDIDTKWILSTPGIVTSLYFIVNLLTKEEDKILIQPPVYNPFYSVVEDNDRVLVYNKLINNDNKYSIDFVDLETKFKLGITMMILCNPQNPIGRVWSYEEMEKIVVLCKRYNVILVSDEIHCDLVLFQNQFTSAGNFFAIYDRIIVGTAPSKTFNVAGLHLANIIIPNDEFRSIIYKAFSHRSLREPNIMGITACRAAYQYCDEWVDNQNKHIENNYLILKEFFQNYPNIKVTNLEGTYLVWVDMRSLKMSSNDIVNKLIEYGIVVNSGATYSNDYDGYIRINIACSKDQLQQGLGRLKTFLNNL